MYDRAHVRLFSERTCDARKADIDIDYLRLIRLDEYICVRDDRQAHMIAYLSLFYFSCSIPLFIQIQ